MNKTILFHACFIAIPLLSWGGEQKIIFEENKNQWPSQVRYQADIPGGKLFLEQNTFTYLYRENIDRHGKHRNVSAEPVKVKYHSYKVNFENSNPEVVVSGNNRHSSHRNYYLGNDPSKWADNIALFSQVYYKDLYANIDMQVYNSEQNLKYDIVVHPGGKPNDIKLKYEGTDGMRIQNGHLFIKTSVYDLIEQKPYAYQEINGRKREINCSYVLEQNTLSFSVGNYDPTLPLIIDPTLIASTYSGSPVDNWGFTATYDKAGNMNTAGIMTGTGYPTTVGAWDATFNGGMASIPMDILILKFNPTGTTLMYATYYGGSLNEQPNSLIVNGNNELYVVGRTNSPNFPKTAGGYGAYIGGYDIIVGKFNSVGNLLSSAIIGGNADDCVNVDIGWDTYGTTKFNYADDGRCDISLDANSNVYVAACSKSTNFPVVNAYQAILAGTQDAVVFKMSSNLASLDWSTYLGGTGTEAAYGIKLDNNNNVFVTGGTSSTDFPTTTGVLNQAYQGGLTDGFISVLNSTGTSLLRSTYLGTSQYDQSFFIDLDVSGDVYVFGQTRGAYPVTIGATNNGQFIHKLSGNLVSTVFSTTIGTGNNAVNISPTAFSIDSCGTIHLAGWGRSSVMSAFMPNPATTTGLPVTSNAYQMTTDGKDFYIAVLEPEAKGLFYATFFGEGASNPDADHIDGGTCRFDEKGILYHAACACGGGFPTTPTAYSPTNNSPNCNQAVFKMEVAVQPIAVANLVGNGIGCTPVVVSFSNAGSICSDVLWDFGDGGTSTLPAPTYTYNFVGTYTITLFCIDSIGICGYIDTSMITISVGNIPSPTMAITHPTTCSSYDGSIQVSASGGLPPYLYSWSFGNTNSIITGLGPSIYTVTVSDAAGCSITVEDTVTCPTGVPEWSSEGVAFYPNPTSGLIRVSHPGNTSDLSVSDVLGRKIYSSAVMQNSTSSVIDLSFALPGVYFLEIKAENGSLGIQHPIQKIMKE